MDMNSVNVIGRLTADPELRFTENSIPVANLRIAINGRNDHVDFIDVIVWGALAETVVEHKSRGDQLAVTGRITSSEWGTDGDRQFRAGITAEAIGFLARARQTTTPDTTVVH